MKNSTSFTLEQLEESYGLPFNVQTLPDRKILVTNDNTIFQAMQHGERYGPFYYLQKSAKLAFLIRHKQYTIQPLSTTEVNTLQAIFDSSGATQQEVADSLQIHLNTLKYRLYRIQEKGSLPNSELMTLLRFGLQKGYIKFKTDHFGLLKQFIDECLPDQSNPIQSFINSYLSKKAQALYGNIFNPDNLVSEGPLLDNG